MASKKPQSSAVKALQKELLELNATPVEGFKVNISSVENMFVWDVAIFGPPKTLYEGGYFKARLFFPPDYPYSPPSMQFLTKMFHPNIYADGEVCISILHSPGEDPQSDELASERWNPTQNVRTILLSVISLLNEPNIHSAAHVDASISYRKWKESNGKENEFEQIVRMRDNRTNCGTCHLVKCRSRTKLWLINCVNRDRLTIAVPRLYARNGLRPIASLPHRGVGHVDVGPVSQRLSEGLCFAFVFKGESDVVCVLQTDKALTSNNLNTGVLKNFQRLPHYFINDEVEQEWRGRTSL
ncbi:ubiquitin-conjugating enzyme E2 R [Clonorchis sinensis]|uniref:Ubiquitin-conjugating enzyme E2 R n=1 Tax=Clonorchis sinensis TaxID=79923 RepID=G7YEA2_CLOSI|nr:ubiquitin-conjugating enzyme E2 R [Clonorchis sinensis]